MSPPTQAGKEDLEVATSDGRQWTWAAAKNAWLPQDPEPFESVEAMSGGTEWMFHPVLRQWIDALQFPDDRGVVPEIGGAVREAVPEQPEE